MQLLKKGSWIFLTLLVLLLVRSAVLKSRKGEGISRAFRMPIITTTADDALFYREEIIDPKAPYAMAHVASMAELPDETLVATWYAGSGELQPDVQIYFSSQQKGSTAWSLPRVIMTREKAAHDLGCFVKGLGNALIFAETDGTLHLLYVAVALGKWSGSMLQLTSSHDGGTTWERSQRLLLSPFFNLSELVKNAPTRLEGGGWAVPAYQEFLGKFSEVLWLLPNEEGILQASKSRIVGGCSFFQPTMTAVSEKKALVWCRDYLASGKITMAQSVTAGRSWSHPEPINLPNHDSGIASLRLQNGWLLLAFNDGAKNLSSHSTEATKACVAPAAPCPSSATATVEAGSDVSPSRNALRLALSEDEGATWQRIATIAEAPRGDFSYPYFLQTRDGAIHLLYSWNRRQIHHVVFNFSWVDSKAVANRKKA